MPTPKQSADIKVTLGQSLERQGEVDKAIAAYREAIHLDPNRADAYLYIAILQDKLGKFRESEDWYRKAADTDHTDAMVNLGLSRTGCDGGSQAWEG